MIDVLDGSASPDRSKNLQPMVSGQDIVAWSALAADNQTDRAVLDYVAALAEATREDESSMLGVSTRGAIGMVRCTRVWAAAQGRVCAVLTAGGGLSFTLCFGGHVVLVHLIYQTH